MLCSHAHECGGCTLQNIDYTLQLQHKQEVIEALFAPFPVAPIIPCADPWRYRNKMEFSFSQNKAGDKFLGLMLRKGRGKVFNLHECLLTSPWFATTLQRVRTWWQNTALSAYRFHRGEGALRTLTLREGKHTGERMAILTLSADPRFAPKKADFQSFIEAIGEASIFLRLQQCLKGSPTQFYEVHLAGPTHIHEKLHLFGRTLTFKISPTSFFQPNTLQAEVLYTHALNMIAPVAHIFDLYSGTGTLSLALSSKAAHVTAIELNPYAVFDAKANAELNGITNCTFICGDVATSLPPLPCDLAVIDPPRTGLDPTALAALLRLNPKQILYISCNPATQAANLQVLSGYRPRKIQPVDQFPHTPHIENIILLDKQSF